jgi:hypothetical protein
MWIGTNRISAQYAHNQVDAVGDTSREARSGEAIIHAQNGDLIVCGRYDSSQAFVARYNEWGFQSWIRLYPFGSAKTVLYDIVERPDGRLVAVGSCKGYLPGNEEVGMLLHLDATGAMLSPSPLILDSVRGAITAIATTGPDDGFVITKLFDLGFPSESWVSRLDAQFDETWTTQTDGYGTQTLLRCVLAVPGQGFFVGGETGTPFIDDRSCVWHLDQNGQIVWEREVVSSDPGDKNNVVYALALDNTGQLLAAGSYFQDAVDESDYMVFRLNPSNGATIDSLIWGGAGIDELHGLALAATGEIMVSGYDNADEFFGRTQGAATWMLLSSGLVMLEQRLWEDPDHLNDHWSMEDIVAVAPNSCGELGFAACGFRTGYKMQRLLWTASCLVGIEEKEPITPWLTYPNPAAPQQTVHIDLEKALTSPAQLYLYTMDGRLVSFQRVRLGVQNLQVEAPLSAGAYMLRLTSENRSLLHKLIVQ